MSWIEDRDIKYIYKMADGSIRHLTLKAKDDAPQEYTFDDGAVGEYNGFEPEEVRQTNVVEFEKNGRKAVRIKDGDGKVRYMSKTKLKYMKTGRIENEYTKDYKEHLQKTRQEEMLRTEYNIKRAKVSKASPEDVLKNLPDGEYLSDGHNVMAAPPGIENKNEVKK